MPRVGFEPTISAGERPKTYAVDRAATATGGSSILLYLIDDARSNKSQIKKYMGMNERKQEWQYRTEDAFTEPTHN